jgi:hypothetical protein
LVRHGHEYDFANFSVDHRETEILPPDLDPREYQDAAFGDFATVDIISRLPATFLSVHDAEDILADPVLRTLYERLLEFDDVRPLTAILNYFLYAGGPDIPRGQAWQALEPVLRRLLEELHQHEFLHLWLDRFNRRGQLDIIDAVRAILAARPWRWTHRVPLEVAEILANQGLRFTGGRTPVEQFAARELTIKEARDRFVVAGHTHRPQVALIAHDRGGERYYLDTGTWRNRVPATADFRLFGRLRSLTYVVVYGSGEDRRLVAPSHAKTPSFEFWTHFTQGWERSPEGVKAIGENR